MGLFERNKTDFALRLTCAVIVVLAATEGAVAWRYLRGQPEARVARLQHELAAKQRELDHLIFLRDSEHRRASAFALAERAAPPAAPANAAPARYVQPEPEPARARIAARDAAESGDYTDRLPTNEDELAEATAQALAGARAQLGGAQRPAGSSTASAPQSRSSDALMREQDEEDRLPSPQGAAPRPATESELNPSDVDAGHLVTMANLMTGRPVAELTRMGGEPLIRYKNTRPAEDDPLWHLLDSVARAHALSRVALVSREPRGTAEADRLRRLADRIESAGVPAAQIELRAGDARYHGLEGILISLKKGNGP